MNTENENREDDEGPIPDPTYEAGVAVFIIVMVIGAMFGLFHNGFPS